MINEHHEIVIVGAGISGLWLAKKLTEINVDFRIVSSDFNGGLLSQIKSNGFNFDCSGGHVYTTSDYRISALMSRIDSRRLTRKAFYRHGDRFVGYPVQDHASEIGIPLNPREGYQAKYRYSNLEEYVVPIFGRNFTNNWFAPFNARVWNTPIYQMDSDWVDGRVKVTQKTDNSWGSNAEFFYAPGPLMFDEIKKSINEDNMIEDVVVFPDIEKKTLTLMSGRVLEYETLIWTPSLKFLLPQMGLNHTRFEANRLMNVCIGLNRKFDDIPDFHWFYPDVRTSPFHRVNKLSNYHQTLAPEGKDALMLERTFKSLPPYSKDQYYRMAKFEQIGSWQRSAQIAPEFAVQLLNEVGINSVDVRDIDVSLIVETPGYPIPTMGIRQEVADVKRALMKKNVILAGRFGSHAYLNINDCMDEAETISGLLELESSPMKTVDKVHDYLYTTGYYKVYRNGKTPEDYTISRTKEPLE